MDVILDSDGLRIRPVGVDKMLQIIELASAAGMREVMTTPLNASNVEVMVYRPRSDNPRKALVPLLILAAALSEEDPAHWVSSWQDDNPQFQAPEVSW
ncbi:hypothetical protein [Micromonospora sp. NPDC003816]|uniref:hypothetical protein n=1 Tax=Micromonospora sp. NPDC003816 TaxID=3364224 RepID=UPI0036979C58